MESSKLQNRIKLLVVDIDGTLVDRNGSISAEDKRALGKVRELGVRVSFSTGRATLACRGILEQLPLDGHHIFFDGALVTNPKKGEEIYVEAIGKDLVRQAVEFARRTGTGLELFSATQYFVERETWVSDIRRRFFGIGCTVVNFEGIWDRERIIKATLVVRSPEERAKAAAFRSHFERLFSFSITRTPAYPDVDFINVVARDVSKGKALGALASFLGIPLDEVMAIGDGYNDIPLLSRARLAVAMGNAPDEVKAVADYVTLDVDHSGVAAATERFLL